MESKIFYSTGLTLIYFGQLIYCFYDNDDELNDDKYFKFYLHCYMQFVILNTLTYISGTIGSATFSQNDILTE